MKSHGILMKVMMWKEIYQHSILKPAFYTTEDKFRLKADKP